MRRSLQVVIAGAVLSVMALFATTQQAQAADVTGTVTNARALITCTDGGCLTPLTGHVEIDGLISGNVPNPSGNYIEAEASWQLTYWSGLLHKVRYDWARTTVRTRGSWIYQTEAHAFLAPGPDPGNPEVFSVYTNSCAQAIQNYASTQTCTSPTFGSSTGKDWWIRSGHYVDLDIDGVKDATCNGCMDLDWKHTG